MASNFFQNNVVDLNYLWYNSHRKLIKRIAAELGASDKQDELITKFIGTQLKIKKQKDPLMPKRSKSSFLYFCDEYRQIVRTENPKFKMADVMKKLGVMWSECKNKDKYVNLARIAKQEYESAMEHYNENNYFE